MSGYSSLVLADSPYAYYKLADTNTTAIDSSGNSRSGTYNGTYTQSQPCPIYGDSGACIFDGGSAYIDIGTPALVVANGMSVSAWIKTAQTGRMIVGGCNTAPSAAWNYFDAALTGTGQIRSSVYQSGTSDAFDMRITTDTGYYNNAWHHFAVSINMSTLTGIFMIDGVSQTVSYASQTGNTTSNLNGDSFIGALNAGGPIVFWNGSLAHLALFNSYISISRWQQHYRAALAGPRSQVIS